MNKQAEGCGWLSPPDAAQAAKGSGKGGGKGGGGGGGGAVEEEEEEEEEEEARAEGVVEVAGAARTILMIARPAAVAHAMPPRRPTPPRLRRTR